MLKTLRPAVPLLILYSAVGLASAFIPSEDEYIENLRKTSYELNNFIEVSKLADTNKDGSISNNEWAEIYKTIGLEYNASSNPAKDLDNGQLVKIIKQNSNKGNK